MWSLKCALAVRAGWCGACYEAIRSGCRSCVEAALRRKHSRKVVFRMGLLKRPSANPDQPRPALPVRLQVKASEVKTVSCYVGDTTYEDGSERETSTVLVFWDDGLIKAVLNDRAEGRSLWVSGSSILDVLVALEDALQSPMTEWRANRQKKR